VFVGFLSPEERAPHERELDGLLRWRTGDFGMVYKIDEEKRVDALLDVGPRKAIYD
jgi:mRNA-degrading endonuclease RelE of RelBE toxin-antitoxin system